MGVAQLYFMPHPLLEIVQRLMAHPVEYRNTYDRYICSVTKITLFAHGEISKKMFMLDVDMINETLGKNFIHIPFLPGKRLLSKWAIVC